MIQAAVTGT